MIYYIKAYAVTVHSPSFLMWDDKSTHNVLLWPVFAGTWCKRTGLEGDYPQQISSVGSFSHPYGHTQVALPLWAHVWPLAGIQEIYRQPQAPTVSSFSASRNEEIYSTVIFKKTANKLQLWVMVVFHKCYCHYYLLQLGKLIVQMSSVRDPQEIQAAGLNLPSDRKKQEKSILTCYSSLPHDLPTNLWISHG